MLNAVKVGTRTQGYMFYFPWKNEERCKIWQINTGNPSILDKPSTDLKTSRLCEDHFEADQFTNSLKQKLRWDALPRAHDSSQMQSAVSTTTAPPCYVQNISPPFLTEKKNINLLYPAPLTVNKKPHDKKYPGAREIASFSGYSNSRHQELEKSNDYDPTSPTLKPILNTKLTPSPQCKRTFQRCTSVRYKGKLFDDTNATPRKRALINLVKKQKDEILIHKSKIRCLQRKLDRVKPKVASSLISEMQHHKKDKNGQRII